VLLVALAGASSPPLAAQTAPTSKHAWVDHLYPFVYYSSIDGFWGAGHYDWSSPMGFAERPEPNFGRVALDVGASTQGSYAFIVDAQAPAYWDGWRLGLTLSLTRANRLGYFGQGNGTTYDRDSTTGPGRSYFYRVSRRTHGARLTVQRRIVGPLRVLVGGSFDHTDFRELPGESMFQRDRIAGVIGPEDLPFNDAVGRAGIVLDSRDLEVDPHRGVFAEALVSSGRGYTRTTAAVRAYAHPLERLILAARVGAEKMTGTPPISAQMTMETSDGPVIALGGYRSLRGYHDGRFVGPGKLVGGVEARYGFLWAPRLLEVKLFVFYDAGRVFGPGESVRLTREGLHSALGGGVAVAMLRNTLLTVFGGKGTEGAQFAFAATWSY
jgi:outer membrane protein assembly factor BamA